MMEGKEKMDWTGMVRLIIKAINKMSDEEYQKFQSFKPDFTVEERQKDQWYLKIGNDHYRVGYIFLRERFLIYHDGQFVLEIRTKKEK